MLLLDFDISLEFLFAASVGVESIRISNVQNTVLGILNDSVVRKELKGFCQYQILSFENAEKDLAQDSI